MQTFRSYITSELFLLLVAVVTTARGEPWNDEQRLFSVLWEADQYDARTRPLKNVSQAVRVNLQADVFAVINLDSKNQEVGAVCEFNLRWEDERLQWNPDNYSRLEFLSVPAAMVWYPRVVVLNALEETRLITDDREVLVTSEGALHFDISLVLNTQCYLNQATFPFDAHTCLFRIGTVNTLSDMILIVASESDNKRNKITTTANWKLEGIAVGMTRSPSCVVRDASEASCKGTSEALVYVKLRREPLFFVYTVMAPCTLLTVVASFIFWLPPESGEKLSLGVSTFLGFVVFQLIVQEALAEAGSGKLSILMRYVLLNYVLSGVALILSAVTVTLHHRGDPEGDSRDSDRCSKFLLHDSVDDQAVVQTSEDDTQNSQGKLQSKKRKSRNWRQTAKCLDRVFFVLYYVAYAVFTGVLVGEVVLI